LNFPLRVAVLFPKSNSEPHNSQALRSQIVSIPFHSHSLFPVPASAQFCFEIPNPLIYVELRPLSTLFFVSYLCGHLHPRPLILFFILFIIRHPRRHDLLFTTDLSTTTPGLIPKPFSYSIFCFVQVLFLSIISFLFFSSPPYFVNSQF